MKRENLKREYEIREMNQNQIDEFMNQNQNYKISDFEDEEDYKMIRKGKKNLFIIHIIEESLSEKKERRILDRDIKIDSRKLDSFGIKLIYHRDKNGDKEYRIFISYKDKDDKLIRRRLRNKKIDSISRDEKKMIEYYQNLSEKEIRDNKIL